MIAEQYLQLKIDHAKRQRAGWTAHQLSDRIAIERFESVREHWKVYEDVGPRKAAIKRFYDFAYVWY